MKALIIGAGVAGPVTALALRKVGIDATIYEAYPNTAHGVGVFMGLAPNGLDALRALDLRDPVQAVGVPTPRMALLNGSGRVLAELANGLTLPDGTTNLTVRRPDLYRVLHEQAIQRGVPIEHGKLLVTVQRTDSGVLARFADGSEATGDFVVGADGLRSRVRELVAPDGPRPEYTGLVGTGGYSRGVRVAAEPGTLTFVFGRRAFFGYLAVDSDQVWWFANQPWAKEPGQLDFTRAESERRLVELFAGDALCPLGATPRPPISAAEIIAATEDDSPWSAMHAMAAPKRWYADRMVLVGDAAHVTSPSSGQGASLAIEDALVLARCLRDLPPADAFGSYQRLREDRVRRVYLEAKRVNSSKAAGPVGRVFRDLLMPVFAKKMADPKARAWLHGHHIDFEAPAAV